MILAAGGSRRLGRPKQALKLKGKTLLQHVVDNALASEAGEVVVVLKPGLSRLKAALGSDPRLRVVVNERWQDGQSASLKVGLQNLSREASAALFLMADQPLVSAAIINALIQKHQSRCVGTAPIVAPRYQGQQGSPVLFPRSLFPELLATEGDRGGRELLERHPVAFVAFPSALPAQDVDTWEDYQSLRRLVEGA